MKVLSYNQFYLKLIGITSNCFIQKTCEFCKSPGNFAYVILIGSAMLTFMSTLIYIFQNIYVFHLTLILRAILIICANLQSTGAYVDIGLKMKKVEQLQLRIQEFVDKGKLNNKKCS